MKDDLGGKLMIEFVALRAKMYAYKKLDKKLEDKCSKGTKKHIVAKRLTFDDLFKSDIIFIGRKILTYFNHFYNWHFSVLLQK